MNHYLYYLTKFVFPFGNEFVRTTVEGIESVKNREKRNGETLESLSFE